MSDISRILVAGSTYSVKDTEARTRLDGITLNENTITVGENSFEMQSDLAIDAESVDGKFLRHDGTWQPVITGVTKEAVDGAIGATATTATGMYANDGSWKDAGISNGVVTLMGSTFSGSVDESARTVAIDGNSLTVPVATVISGTTVAVGSSAVAVNFNGGTVDVNGNDVVKIATDAGVTSFTAGDKTVISSGTGSFSAYSATGVESKVVELDSDGKGFSVLGKTGAALSQDSTTHAYTLSVCDASAVIPAVTLSDNVISVNGGSFTMQSDLGITPASTEMKFLKLDGTWAAVASMDTANEMLKFD